MNDDELPEQPDILDEDLVEDLDGEETKKSKRARLRIINLDLVNKQLVNTLARDVRHLFRANVTNPLSEEDSKKLINYLKLLKELRKSVSADDMEKLSEAQLEKLIQKDKPESENS